MGVNIQIPPSDPRFCSQPNQNGKRCRWAGRRPKVALPPNSNQLNFLLFDTAGKAVFEDKYVGIDLSYAW